MKPACSFLLSLISPVFAVLLSQCAGEVPPSGGPVDTTPPEIVATSPEPNTVNFSGNRILLEFDEYVDERSVQESIFISPSLGRLEFDWSGKRVEIRFPDSLRKSTTYVLTVGTDVLDIRNRNRMEKAFSLAFATGAAIDSGTVSGRVFDDKSEGVMIFAYLRDSLEKERPDPSTVKPHYITQSGRGGFFSLTHLSLGLYRLFAVRDDYKNLLYDIGVDQIGIYDRDVTIDSTRSSYSGVQFRLTKEDTTRPQLFNATSLDRRHVSLRFSKPIDSNRFSTESLVITDTLTGERLDLNAGFVEVQNPFSVVLETQDQKPGSVYRVTVARLFDTTGNIVDPKINTAVFEGAAVSDTTAPKILYISVSDSARLIPLDVRVQIRFDDAVKRSELEESFSLVDRVGMKVMGSFHWSSSAAFEFVPSQDLVGKSWYQMRLPLSSVIDFSGNQGLDTLLVRSFETIDPNVYGSIEGEIFDQEEEGGLVPIVVQAREIRRQGGDVLRLKLLGAGKFEFPRIREGMYVVGAFRDEDEDGKYSHGKAYPFRPSETFAYYPDTVKVRARWPVQGLRISLR